MKVSSVCVILAGLALVGCEARLEYNSRPKGGTTFVPRALSASEVSNVFAEMSAPEVPKLRFASTGEYDGHWFIVVQNNGPAFVHHPDCPKCARSVYHQ